VTSSRMGCLLDSLGRGYRVLGICSSSYWRSQTDAMENDGSLLTIGELARRVGVPVRTIRFWSDSRLVPPASRTDGDRRLYDAACVARLELVTTLRELGVINKLARLSAAERRQIIDDFTAEVFHGVDPSPARSWRAPPAPSAGPSCW